MFQPHSLIRIARLALAALLITTLGACSLFSKTPKPTTSEAENLEKLYADAREDEASGAYDRAIKSFERLEGRAAGTVLAQQAQLELAWLYNKTGEKAQALTTLDRFMKLHPTSPAMDYALYLKGLVNFIDNLGILGNFSNQNLSERDQQASRDSFQSFRRLVEQYPQSTYAPDARLRMDYIVNSLAAYEVHVARYYFRRGAYVAAANRAQQAIQEFQTSTSVEEALFLLARSYDRLGLGPLRDDAERVLRTNYPNSEFLTADGVREVEKPWWKPF